MFYAGVSLNIVVISKTVWNGGAWYFLFLFDGNSSMEPPGTFRKPPSSVKILLNKKSLLVDK
jgi:hypothetical protein